MGPLLEAMGLTVGWITAESTADERREAYKCNITYASVNEIGFDVLRDQLVTDVSDLVSPNPDVALIDEADSVLVDEALAAGGPAPPSRDAWWRSPVGELTPRITTPTRQPQRTHRGGRPVEAGGSSVASTCTR
jgi:preprotein translocase subunit SecA